MIDPTLLDVLVCPIARCPLVYNAEKNELVSGRYKVPEDAGTVRVKITDLLSESWEGSIDG